MTLRHRGCYSSRCSEHLNICLFGSKRKGCIQLINNYMLDYLELRSFPSHTLVGRLNGAEVTVPSLATYYHVTHIMLEGIHYSCENFVSWSKISELGLSEVTHLVLQGGLKCTDSELWHNHKLDVHHVAVDTFHSSSDFQQQLQYSVAR